MRKVLIPLKDGWLTRFNKRFAVDKSSYDGRFTSRLGRGECTSEMFHRGLMVYRFEELNSKERKKLNE